MAPGIDAFGNSDGCYCISNGLDSKRKTGSYFNDTNQEEPTIPLNKIVKGWPFYLLLIGSMCSIGAVAGTSQNLKLFFSLDLKYTQGQSANIISLVLLSSIIGRVLMGWLADQISKEICDDPDLYTCCRINTAALFFLNSRCHLFIRFYFRNGTGWRLYDHSFNGSRIIWSKIMGRVMGLVLTADGLAEAFSPMLVGWLRDKSGSYANGFAVLDRTCCYRYHCGSNASAKNKHTKNLTVIILQS